MCILVLLLLGGLPAAQAALNGADWTMATNTPALPARYGHSSVIYNDGTTGNQMWILGGLKSVATGWVDDVWHSADGVTWTQSSPSTVFDARDGHTSVVSDDLRRVWVIGGRGSDGGGGTQYFNDVWVNSTNGVDWTKVSSANPADLYTARYGHSSVYFQDKLWVIGGLDETSPTGMPYNDVWSSADNGVTWTQGVAAAPFAERFGHSSVVFNGMIWVIGGDDWLNNAYPDVWNSTNGVDWNQKTASAGFGTRAGHTSVVADGKMWVIGGYTYDGGGNKVLLNDVWYSSDGVTWTRATPSAKFDPRWGQSSLAFDDGGGTKIWVIAGNNGTTTDKSLKDIWFNPPPPAVSGITPGRGANDGSVSITNLAGTGFMSGATVKLTKSGQTDITASSATRVSYNKITCSFSLSGKATGSWNVVVTNPDGQSGTLTDGFTVTLPGPIVTGITPEEYWNLSTLHVTIDGSGFLSGATVNLTKTGQANITNLTPSVSSTSISCDLPLAGTVVGDWNVTVTNTDGQYDNLTTFRVLAPYPVIDLTQTSPSEGTNTTIITMTIIGDYFVDGATVKLIKSGENPIVGTNVKVYRTQISCNFDLNGIVADTWTLRVTNPDGQSNSANNLFQLAVLAGKSVISSSGGGGGGGGGGTPSAPAAVAVVPQNAQNQPAPQAQSAAPAGAGTSAQVSTAALSTTAEGVTTQESSLESSDSMATVSIPQGTVATDSGGSPLTSVSIAPLSSLPAPADAPGSTFTGMAYDLGPNGATFSPAITLTFAVSTPREGQTYTVRMFDDAASRWVDVPTTYHPESGTVTAEVSGFCCFALFARTTVPTAAAIVPTLPKPVPSPAARTPMAIFSGLMVSGVNQVIQYPVIIPAIVIIIIALVIYGRKRRRDRRKERVDRLMEKP